MLRLIMSNSVSSWIGRKREAGVSSKIANLDSSGLNEDNDTSVEDMCDK